MATLRVIAGTARGRRLKMVPGDTTRPIMDRVKEALFNIIGTSIYDARFLDLFAGTGSVAIEALSRGAAHALALDLSREAVQTIQDNLRVTRLEARAEVRRGDAFAFLASTPSAFDFIYIAPPQYQGLWKRALMSVDDRPEWLAKDGLVIVQIDPVELEEVALRHLVQSDERKYGSTLLLFFEHSHRVERES